MKCRVPKLFHPCKKISSKNDNSNIYNSSERTEDMTKLNDKKIRWILSQKKRGELKNSKIALAMNISTRRVQQINSEHKRTGQIPMLSKKRRPKKDLTEDEKKIIDSAYNDVLLGARLLRYHILRYYQINISHNKIHSYLLSKRYASENERKKKKRNRCRYERKHSLSLLHADWAEHNDKKIIAFEDDASRKIVAIGEFSNATTKNSLEVLKKAEREARSYNYQIVQINTDRGSQFFANKQNKRGTSEGQFQKYLKSRGIKHIPSRRNNPQTNGKIERWIQEYKKHRHRFKNANEFMNWYNNRLHGALDLDNAETPNEAFIRKMRYEAILGMFFKNIVQKELL